ncbi:hypothetical protein VOLCADRAFT_117810 [Volvox carteri f. nagariensis]|uniref:MYND-type domain-containing protein n=1 Tax=Volvox carteri f. nagariensis TaxID=3068 RepID=D8TY32_VOLCA|nr:uncharacterized protein VOLCADRAFT_117810 [Volvox carteri f. nagariensis]EFJ47575.1 hypothetical protein VOLCADRAFT_117810 [Volvox carteri f. nagariensis]|eukprot:XP_002951399.1 hypothetical protein VOLCADRAFT_117810 [Volvox carteri f. nagariensis]
MVGKGSIAAPAWKALLAASTTSIEKSLDDRASLIKPLISQIQAILDENSGQPAGSQKLYTALAIGTLNTAIAGLDRDSPNSYWQLLAINDVIVGSDRRLAHTLVEHQFLNSLWRLHDKVGNMSHRLAQAVVMIFCSVTLSAEGAAGSMETIAAKPELLELLMAQLTFLAVATDVLLSPTGLGTAQRCLQTCWELTRAATPKCREFREKLQQAHMAGRALQMAAAATVGRSDADGGTDVNATAATAAISRVAVLESRGGGDGTDPATTSTDASAGPGAMYDNLYEDRLSLAAQACSFAANLAGLGTRGIELSAVGLAPQRAWLLKPGTLSALREPLQGLVDGLAELRRRMEVQGPEATDRSDTDDLRPGPVPRKRLLSQVEGAIRNLLVLLGLPTIVMGRGEEDVVESCGFVIRHSFGLFTEGYVDTMRALRAAVAEPFPPGAATAPGGAQSFTARYPGDYGQFFRAFAGHIETVAPALGVQLEDWGVRFTGEQAARDLPGMKVGEGVDARIAQSWLKDQIQQIINWGHSMMIIVRMADQTKMEAFQQQQQQQQQQQGSSGGLDPSLPKPAAPRPYGASAASGVVAGKAGAGPPAAAPWCASCGTAPQSGGTSLLWCSRCRTVRYCSRACQVGHWSQHKATCQATAAAPATAAAAPAAVAEGSTSEVAHQEMQGAWGPVAVAVAAPAAVEEPAATAATAEADLETGTAEASEMRLPGAAVQGAGEDAGAGGVDARCTAAATTGDDVGDIAAAGSLPLEDAEAAVSNAEGEGDKKGEGDPGGRNEAPEAP